MHRCDIQRILHDNEICCIPLGENRGKLAAKGDPELPTGVRRVGYTRQGKLIAGCFN